MKTKAKTKDKAPKKLTPGSICNDCAKLFKLVWPKGHVATFWYGECDQCGLPDKSCCSTGDYNRRGGDKVEGLRD